MTLAAWLIMLVPLTGILFLAVYAGRYVRGIADYLAAGRVAGRYVISVGDLASALGVVTLVAMVEQQYQSGLGLGFWSGLGIPVALIMSLTGYCVYRFRETRALSMGQFLEMRYSRRLRIAASALRAVADMMFNAIAPAVTARFLIYFLGLPQDFPLFALRIPTFPVTVAAIIGLALLVLWWGGRVSLIITDAIQCLLSYPIFVIFTIYILAEFSFFNDIGPVLLDRVPNESYLDPYDISELRDFNLFAVFVGLLGSVLQRASWIGNDTSASARTPHEQKMAGILGAWRNGFSLVMCFLISVTVIALMNRERFAPVAHDIRAAIAQRVVLDTIADEPIRAKVLAAVAAIPEQRQIIGVDPPLSRERNLDTPYFDAVQKALAGTEGEKVHLQQFWTLYHQTMTPMALSHLFPPFLMGLFGLLMVMFMLTTDDSRIFNASTTFVQDVVMPLAGKPLDTRTHFLWLRWSTAGVCVFFFVFSLFFSQLDYILLFMVIIGSIWLGGAGPVMVFGLYTRFGTAAGAWASLVIGCGISIGGVLLQQTWAGYVYPWLDALGWVEGLDALLQTVSAPFHPWVVWRMNDAKFPINSWEIYFLAMILGVIAYVGVSLLTCREPFNLDRMLHRGIYRVEGDAAATEPEVLWSWRTLSRRLLGFTSEYTRGDKIITWSVLLYSLGFQFGISFLGMVIWNYFWPISSDGWLWYFFLVNLVVACVIGAVSTVWFSIGGYIHLSQFLRDMKARRNDPLDDGWVDGHISRVDLEQIAGVESSAQRNPSAATATEKSAPVEFPHGKA